MSPPYGYPLVNEREEWFDRGGFSVQPNLLAGCLPYLDRDEPEIERETIERLLKIAPDEMVGLMRSIVTDPVTQIPSNARATSSAPPPLDIRDKR